MYKYLKEHELFISGLLASAEPRDWQQLADYHKVQIEFLQHERLAHLITTLAFAAITMAAYVCSVVFASAVLILVSLVLTVFDVFYIIHYYRLENGIQRWYKIYNSLCKKQNGSGDQA